MQILINSIDENPFTSIFKLILLEDRVNDFMKSINAKVPVIIFRIKHHGLIVDVQVSQKKSPERVFNRLLHEFPNSRIFSAEIKRDNCTNRSNLGISLQLRYICT